MIEICFLKLNHKFLYGCKLNLFAIGLYLILSLNNQTHANISLMPDNSETITFGKDIYLQECASCHGKNLAGQANWQERDDKGYMPAPPHDKNGHTWHHSDHNLFLMTKYGIEKIIGKKYYTARGKKIDKIINLVESKSSFKVTLGGCLIKKVNETVILSKE